MQLKERATAASELWKAVMPGKVAPPEPREFIFWAHRFDEESITKAIIRASVKFTDGLDTRTAVTFITGTLIKMERRRLSVIGTHRNTVTPATPSTVGETA
jgi:hypothetical protein